MEVQKKQAKVLVNEILRTSRTIRETSGVKKD